MKVSMCEKCGAPSYLQSMKHNLLTSNSHGEFDISKKHVFKCPVDGDFELVTHYAPRSCIPQPPAMQDEKCERCEAERPLQSQEMNLIRERSDLDGGIENGADVWEMIRVFKCPIHGEFVRRGKFMTRRPQISASPQ